MNGNIILLNFLSSSLTLKYLLLIIYYFEGSEWASEALATPIDLSLASKLMSWVTELMFDVM